MPVQDYAGQDYSLPNGEKTGAFAKTHKKEIVDQVNKFFKEKYHLEVTTHNLVGATNAVVAYVESKGEPHFHTSVIIGVDLASQKVTGSVGAYEGSIEGSIMSGLYVMAYEKEFKNLDRFAESVVKNYPVIGKNKKAIDNTWDSGFATSFYYVTSGSGHFSQIYNAYMRNHNITTEELRKLFKQQNFDPSYLRISLTFFMGEKYAQPDKKIADALIYQVQNLTGIAKGTYSVFVNSNEINKITGIEKQYEGTIPAKNEIVVKEMKR
ncbi:DUF1672 family protein [Sporolactobacillus sp. CQH2019]|nr:DUF1672 family protein [Sporolactobacillus sp. CQH2019]MDD9147990.1 DUF1672 family protein [Sporolactobacillus sp. CQH2019]